MTSAPSARAVVYRVAGRRPAEGRPESAGADPGPICYDNGAPTRRSPTRRSRSAFLDPGDFLGGEMDTAAEDAIDGVRRRSRTLDTTVEDASRGVFDVAGYHRRRNPGDNCREGPRPRDFSMLAYGGAGLMFVLPVARELGVKEVVAAGAPVFSAWGC